MRTKIFAEVVGQSENIGDSILRRSYLDALRAVGDLHLLVGQHAGYISGLRLDPRDVCYEKRRQWLRPLLGCLVKGQRVCIAPNSGETVISLLRPKKTWWLMLLNRLVGGRNIFCGVGLRNIDSPSLPFADRIMSKCYLLVFDYVSWRDHYSRKSVEGVGEIAPDWAFAEGQSDALLARPDISRGYVAISLRGDRPFPNTMWLIAIKDFSLARGLELIAVAQVARDVKHTARIAELLGCRHVDWSDAALGNFAREKVVRDIYRKSAMVVSDRLHALILGLTEGAVPLGFPVRSAEKCDRALATVGIHGACYSASGGSAEGFAQKADGLMAQQGIFMKKVQIARRQLKKVEHRLGVLIR